MPPSKQPSSGFPTFLEAQALHGIRDGAQVSFSRTVKDDVVFTTPEIELVYHIDATTNSCAFGGNLNPAKMLGTMTERKLQVGTKSNGANNIVTYPGIWNIDRVSIEDRGDGTTRVNFTVSQIGKPIKIDIITPEKIDANEKWVPESNFIAANTA